MADTLIMIIGMETVAPMRMMLTAKVIELVRMGGVGPGSPSFAVKPFLNPSYLTPHVTGETWP